MHEEPYAAILRRFSGPRNLVLGSVFPRACAAPAVTRSGARPAVSEGPIRQPGRAAAGARNRATLLAEALLEGEGSGLTRRAVEVGLEGNPYVLRAWLDRLIPPRRERAVQFDLPPIDSPADLAPAMGAVMAALAAGEVTPGEAERITNAALAWMRAIENSDLAVQLQKLRERDEQKH